MTGNNFKEDFIDNLVKLNKQYKNAPVKINELFGSIRKLQVIKSARPDFRVPDIELNVFRKIIDTLNENDMIANYTINTPIVNHHELNEKDVENFMMDLKNYGIKRVTVAHPLLMKVISKVSDMPIEISTIYRLLHPRQLYDLKQYAPNINKLCCEVYYNRNRFLLEELQEHCTKLNIELELLANEFCIQNCIVRDQCYHAHTMNKVFEDTTKFGHFPMGYCISHRERNPEEWLSANFIMPQHMKLYEEKFEISQFKVTGRTAPTKYLSWIIEEYLKMDYHGNLLQLWQDVKNLKRVAEGEQDYRKARYELDSNAIDDDFMNFYLDTEKPIQFQQERDHIKKYLNRALQK